MTQLLPVARAWLSSHQRGLEKRKQEVFKTGNEALLQGPECSGNPAEKGASSPCPAETQGGGRWGWAAGHLGSTPGGATPRLGLPAPVESRKVGSPGPLQAGREEPQFQGLPPPGTADLGLVTL